MLAAILPLTVVSGGVAARVAASDVKLADAPKLAVPDLSVDEAGFVQVGRQLELGALVTNHSSTLDAREANVMLVAFDEHDNDIGTHTQELLSIPAGSTVAVAARLQLDGSVTATRAEAHLSLPDAAVARAEWPLALATTDVSVNSTRGTIIVSGQIEPVDVYPVPYEIDAVLVDSEGKFAGTAQGELRPESNTASPFTARGALPEKADLADLRAVVTILPAVRD
jgi:hypothetical protein